MGSCYGAVCCDNWSHSIYPTPGANTQLCNWQKPSRPQQSLLHALRLVGCRVLQLFHQRFAAYRPSYLSQRFRTLIRQFKGPYFTALLSSDFAHWPTFDIVLRSQFYPLCQLHRVFSQWMLTFFHDIGSVVHLVNLTKLSSVFVYQLYFWPCFDPFLDVS